MDVNYVSAAKVLQDRRGDRVALRAHEADPADV
jgi:hypothetical protein